MDYEKFMCGQCVNLIRYYNLNKRCMVYNSKIENLEPCYKCKKNKFINYHNEYDK